MSRAAARLAFVLLAAAMLTGCITNAGQVKKAVASQLPGHDQRVYCKQAREQGWCSPECYRRIPAHCAGADVVLISCNDAGMCTWWSEGGRALVYGYSPSSVTSAPPSAPLVKLNRRQRVAIRVAYAWHTLRDWATRKP